MCSKILRNLRYSRKKNKSKQELQQLRKEKGLDKVKKQKHRFARRSRLYEYLSKMANQGPQPKSLKEMKKAAYQARLEKRKQRSEQAK